MAFQATGELFLWKDMTEFYKKIVRKIKNLIIDNDNILAAWEGGSAAT